MCNNKVQGVTNKCLSLFAFTVFCTHCVVRTGSKCGTPSCNEHGNEIELYSAEQRFSYVEYFYDTYFYFPTNIA